MKLIQIPYRDEYQEPERKNIGKKEIDLKVYRISERLSRIKNWIRTNKTNLILNYSYIEELKRNLNSTIQKFKENYCEIKFYDIYRELEFSKKILEYEAGWNGEGSRGYSETTWFKMKNFIINIFKKADGEYNLILPTPYIEPGIMGDIDIHWKTNKFELLLTIPENQNEPISYYGDNFGLNVFKGVSDFKNIDMILIWMKKFL